MMKNFRHSKEITLDASMRPERRLRKRSIFTFMWAVMICVSLLCWSQPAAAQTFNDAMSAQLAWDGDGLGCARLVGVSPRDINNNYQPLNFGPQLAVICGLVAPPASEPSPGATGGSGGTGLNEVVQKRLRELREEESKEADDDLGSGISLWVSGHSQKHDRDTTKFEDGYDSNIWGVTVGADFPLNDSWVAGLAFNLNRWDGDLKSGGSFDTDSYGPTIYASFVPDENFFADVVFSYVRRDASSDRSRTWLNEADDIFGGKVASDPDESQVDFGISLGYDYPIRQFSVGPRIGFDFVYNAFDGYAEKGDTGLELEYDEDTRVSLQSKLGGQAAMSISTAFGVLVPQFGADWIHEYADNQRLISVRFVQDLRDNPTKFSFETDKPDRDFFELSAGVSAVLPHNIQAFVNYRILVGHDFYDNQVGTAGLRVTF